MESKATGYDVIGDPRPAVTAYVALHQLNDGTFPSLAALMRDIAKQVMEYGTLSKIPAATVGNTRNEMYLVSEAIRFLMKDKESDLSTDDIATLNKYKGSLCSGNFRYVCVDVARFFLPVGKVGLGLGVKR